MGFGSLLDRASLRASAPGVLQVRPCYALSLERDFSFWDPVGWTATNLELAGESFCAVNVRPRLGGRVNGVAFSVNEAEYAALLVREAGYDAIELPVFDYATGAEFARCVVFSAGEAAGAYRWGSPAQERYLEVCLAGAHTHGRAFFEEWTQTTLLDGLPVADNPALAELLARYR
jgi:cation transport regulator ChaC